MNKINCEVIQDILPIYVENMTSPSSNALVEEHLLTCEKCRELEKSMRKQVTLPKDMDAMPLKKIRNKVLRKRVTAIGVTILCMSLLALLLVVHLNSPITIPYEQIATSIDVQEAEDGTVSVYLDNPGVISEFSDGTDEYDGAPVMYLRCYTTRWNLLIRKSAGESVYRVGGTGEEAWEQITGETGDTSDFQYDDTEKNIKRIYYYPGEKGESVLLYEAGAEDANSSHGVIVLPRLTLNYYLLLAGALMIIGVICCFLFRKDAKKCRVVLKISLFPAAYVFSSLAVLSGKGEIYDTEYYFTGILMITIVAYVIVWWIIEYFHQQRIFKSSKNSVYDL